MILLAKRRMVLAIHALSKTSNVLLDATRF